MSAHLTGTLLRAECNRVMGLSTLQAEFEQHGRFYTRSRIVAFQCFGTADTDWARCLALYASLTPGQAYAVSGDTLAASDGTVLLLGTFSIRPAAAAARRPPGYQPDISAVAVPLAAPGHHPDRAAA